MHKGRLFDKSKRDSYFSIRKKNCKHEADSKHEGAKLGHECQDQNSKGSKNGSKT